MHPIVQTISVIKKNDEAIARWISHLISPHIVGIALTAFLAVKYSDESLAEVLTWATSSLAWRMWLASRSMRC